MTSLHRMLQRLARPERGATAVEYGLMVALIAIIIIASIALFGDRILGLFD